MTAELGLERAPGALSPPFEARESEGGDPPNAWTMQDAPGRVVLVGAGPGDPDLLTLRGWRALQQAEVVLYDSLVDTRLLEGLSAQLVFVGKRCDRHAMSQEQITELLVRLAREGRRVVRLKGGDPGVFGRVGEEALSLAEEGVPFEIVPGVSSATAVPLVAGIPVTHRGLADAFVVVTAHRRNGELELSIPDYHARTTLVLMMARNTVREWRQELLARGYPRELPVAFISAGCSDRERVVTTTVRKAEDELRLADLDTPVLAVVGWVVPLRRRLGAARAAEEESLRVCHHQAASRELGDSNVCRRMDRDFEQPLRPR
jgi:uroporphyrin-III C-methyltransferase